MNKSIKLDSFANNDVKKQQKKEEEIQEKEAKLERKTL